MSVIEATGLSKVYGFGDATTVALDNVDVEIKKGEFVAIMGPSGSGKSTLMNIIGLLDKPTHGSYHLDGKDVSRLNQKQQAKFRRENIGFIFQSFNLLPRMTAVENVALPLMYKGVSHVKRMTMAEKMMDNVGLKDRQYYYPNQLSGGQVQRVAVARALANKPSIVLADEPTGNLDSKASLNILKLLHEIHLGGNTIIMVTHNPELTLYCDRVIMMRDGKIADAYAPPFGKEKKSAKPKKEEVSEKKSKSKKSAAKKKKGSKS
jgi:putative ABC transport system ATP-binding protein